MPSTRPCQKPAPGFSFFANRAESLEVLLAHPGGPFWAKKDDGAWTIPKGELGEDEEPLSAAKREFEEEMGQPIDGDFVSLGELTQAGGKRVTIWAIRANFDPASLKSNMFSIEWPPKSGQYQSFPEVDRAAWFDIETARRKILKSQAPFLDRLLALPR